MSKDLIKKAWDLAEKEAQEKEVNRVKEIITAYLTKVDEQEKLVKKEQAKLTLLKKDIDDLKAGRLDKIEERQEKDVKAKDVSLIIVKKIEKEYIPMYPWRSPWIVEWNSVAYPYYSTYTNLPLNGSQTITVGYANCTSGTNNYQYNCANSSANITGISFSNFAQGTYDINGHTISI